MSNLIKIRAKTHSRVHGMECSSQSLEASVIDLIQIDVLTDGPRVDLVVFPLQMRLADEGADAGRVRVRLGRVRRVERTRRRGEAPAASQDASLDVRLAQALNETKDGSSEDEHGEMH